jgi:hypothetical protein
MLKGPAPSQLSQYFLSAAVNLWKLAEGQQTAEFSRISQAQDAKELWLGRIVVHRVLAPNRIEFHVDLDFRLRQGTARRLRVRTRGDR